MSWDTYLVSTEVTRVIELPDMDGAEIIGASFIVRARDKDFAKLAVIDMIGEAKNYIAPRFHVVTAVTIE